MLTFSITADASGSKDAVTIPQNANYAGYKTLKIRPPQGHSWSHATVPSGGSTVTMGSDEELTLYRGHGEYSGGEVVLYIANDTGTGTFKGILT